MLCTCPADVKFDYGASVRRSVLVVDSQPDELARSVAILQGAGYDVSCAASFEEGRRLLSVLEPLVLLTSIKLGGHNGLHLVLRARLARSELSAIVTHHVHDTVLEAEARRQEATFIVQPCSNAELIGHVRSAADTASRAAALARQISQS